MAWSIAGAPPSTSSWPHVRSLLVLEPFPVRDPDSCDSGPGLAAGSQTSLCPFQAAFMQPSSQKAAFWHLLHRLIFAAWLLPQYEHVRALSLYASALVADSGLEATFSCSRA